VQLIVVYPTRRFKMEEKAVWGICAKRHLNDTQLKKQGKEKS